MFLTSIDNYSFRYQFLFLPSTCEWDRELSWFNRPQYSFWDSLASGLPNAFGKWGILPFISNKEVKSAHLSDPEKVLLQTTLCGILPFSLHFLSVWITLEFYLTKKKKKKPKLIFWSWFHLLIILQKSVNPFGLRITLHLAFCDVIRILYFCTLLYNTWREARGNVFR